MKTAKDPRHIKRTKLVQDLFSWSFSHSPKVSEGITKIIPHLSEIDKSIEKSAPSWPINQINKIDLAILRLSVFELIIVPRLHRDHVISQHAGIKEQCDCDIIEKEQPPKVIVDEAVELGK